MELVISVLALIAMLGAITLLVLLFIDRLRARRRQRAMEEALQLAMDAFTASVEPVAVRADSEAGRRLISEIRRRGSCGCPDCEEERRIAHAEQQQQQGDER
ncbi:hypothetical protein MUN78_04585 [Leucobacter allii]|uniref:Histidine kinase n=1 Tax=Leucobacter allii TaxID=2932247 RepID=A0ABY4FPC2_9MICO|nr:hypothetical protein [Leucobacter allii]UOQ58129.1 hypothetical protein MUN78_04585 [Leucobacter allii]